MIKKPALPDPAGVTFAPMGAESSPDPVAVTTETGVADMVAWLLSPHRRDPLVVITSEQNGESLWIDAEAIAVAHPGASVFTIRTGKLTRLLEEYLSSGQWGVFGGGGRVYPPGMDLSGDPRSVPLFLCGGAGEGAEVTSRMLSHMRGSRAEESVVESEVTGRVDTAAGAVRLAAYLRSEDRRLPVVVVTNAMGHPPYLDVAEIEENLQGHAEVVVLEHGKASWAFTGALPDRLGVFGGAARTYPPDLEWLDDETHAPLRFCWHGQDTARVVGEVIDDALSAAFAAGLLAVPTDTSRAESCAATVQGAIGDHHILLEMPDGGQAVALSAALRPGIQSKRLVRKGQQLVGFVTRQAAFTTFALAPVEDDAASRVQAAYPDGAAVLAKVTDVGELSARVALHPDVEAWLTVDQQSTPLSRMADVGDVIVVQVAYENHRIACQLAESDDGLLPAVPVIPGGPPWLIPEDLSQEEPAPAPQPLREPPAPPLPAPSSPKRAEGDELAAMYREMDLLNSQLAAAQQEADRSKKQASSLRQSLRDAEKKAKVAARRAQEFEDRARGLEAYSDPERQLRHEIQIQYLYRIPEAQRTELPLAEYRFGPDFLDSLENLEGISRDKVVDVLVEVLTGLADSLAGRQVHHWRTSETGPQETRSDGAAAWRCSLQVNTPSARRLKYWRLPGGVVEFDSVGVHDKGI